MMFIAEFSLATPGPVEATGGPVFDAGFTGPGVSFATLIDDLATGRAESGTGDASAEAGGTGDPGASLYPNARPDVLERVVGLAWGGPSGPGGSWSEGTAPAGASSTGAANDSVRPESEDARASDEHSRHERDATAADRSVGPREMATVPGPTRAGLPASADLPVPSWTRTGEASRASATVRSAFRATPAGTTGPAPGGGVVDARIALLVASTTGAVSPELDHVDPTEREASEDDLDVVGRMVSRGHAGADATPLASATASQRPAQTVEPRPEGDTRVTGPPTSAQGPERTGAPSATARLHEPSLPAGSLPTVEGLTPRLTPAPTRRGDQTPTPRSGQAGRWPAQVIAGPTRGDVGTVTLDPNTSPLPVPIDPPRVRTGPRASLAPARVTGSVALEPTLGTFAARVGTAPVGVEEPARATGSVAPAPSLRAFVARVGTAPAGVEEPARATDSVAPAPSLRAFVARVGTAPVGVEEPARATGSVAPAPSLRAFVARVGTAPVGGEESARATGSVAPAPSLRAFVARVETARAGVEEPAVYQVRQWDVEPDQHHETIRPLLRALPPVGTPPATDTFRLDSGSADLPRPSGMTGVGMVDSVSAGVPTVRVDGAMFSETGPTPLDRTLPPRLVRSARFLVRAGGGEARIRLQPEHLGEILMTVKVDRGVVTAVLQVESEAARGWIRTHQELLRTALEQQGLEMDRFTVTDRQRRDTHDPREQPEGESRRRPRLAVTSPDTQFEIPSSGTYQADATGVPERGAGPVRLSSAA